MEINMQEVDYFATNEMYLAACLIHDGIEYLRVDRSNPKKLVFIFRDSPEIARIQAQRANATHVVSSVAYDDARRRIQSIIFSDQ